MVDETSEGTHTMIVLTRLNGHHITVNSDLIKYAESSPDTMLTLITGEKIVVLETCEQVQQSCKNYRVECLREVWPECAAPLASATAFVAHTEARHQQEQ